jgi:subtilisin family serine protease
LICVAQTNSSDAKVSSGFGAGLDLLAPGARVPGIVWGSNSSAITKLSGSSLAAPCTAGVAALVLSVHGGLRAREVAAILAKSCDPLGTATGWNKRTGWGRLNARNAVELALRVKNGTVDLQALMIETDQTVLLPSPPPLESPGLHG